MKLADKAIIVTGSTTGIGEAIARRCIAEGARVLVHGRDFVRGEALVAELGDRAALHVDDLADPESSTRIVSAALKAFGQIDGLVNNAATVERSDLETTTVDFFDRVMQINLRAPLLLIQSAIDHLKKSAGSIVNIGSVNAYAGEPKLLAYSISKGGLMTMSRNLANVLARDKVRVTHLNVGWVLTPNEYYLKISEGLASDWPETLSPLEAPTGRMTQPEEIARHVAYWLSDDSRPISGSVLELEQYSFLGRNDLKEGEPEG